MIKYVRQEAIDRQKWDACISNSANGLIYAYSWYLDSICEEWHALVENDYEAVMPLPTRRKLFIQYAFQPFFAQQLGIFSPNPVHTDRTNNFLSAIPRNYSYIEINLNSHNHPEKKNIVYQNNKNYILRLYHSYEVLKEKFSTNTKRNIEDAITNNLKIVDKIDPIDIINLFRNDRGKTIKRLKTENYKTLHDLMNLLIEKEKAITLGVYNEENELLAAAFFVAHNNRYIFLFSGNSDEGREKKAMFLLVNHFISQHSDIHAKLDFEGSNNPGIARFYKSFGAIKVHYKSFFSNRMIFPLNMLFTIYRKLR
ncbi:MAG: hypothetical protein WCH34_03210 [Bacteroidota bacterium]